VLVANKKSISSEEATIIVPRRAQLFSQICESTILTSTHRRLEITSQTEQNEKTPYSLLTARSTSINVLNVITSFSKEKQNLEEKPAPGNVRLTRLSEADHISMVEERISITKREQEKLFYSNLRGN
jgi:hypothetical protein